jgi:hypothetical protein
MITVTCRKRDIAVQIHPKYDTLDDFDVTPENPKLPNGVYGYRHLRETSPKTTELSPLAAWLVEKLEGRVICGMWPNAQSNRRVRCFMGMRDADLVRHEAAVNASFGTTQYIIPETRELDFERAKKIAEGFTIENPKQEFIYTASTGHRITYKRS